MAFITKPETDSKLSEIRLKPEEFQQISRLAYERFGLNLVRGKEGLVAARLGKGMRRRGFNSFSEYHRHVLADATGESLIELIDALTTNHTSFLREKAHFDYLAELVRSEYRGTAGLKVWSAACSSGEEPYTIAMCLLQAAGRGSRTAAAGFKILATDISTRVLEKARRGVYDGERFQGLPDSFWKPYVLRGEGASKGSYKIRPEVAALVQFDRLNLIEPFPAGRLFHVIFCRNVMIYFDKPTQQDIVQRLAARLEPGGYLFVGHSESLTGIQHNLRYVRPAIYRNERAGRSWL